MNFTDKILVRLADPATRGALFDAASLEQMASAAYDTSRMAIEGPFNAVFEELQLGVAVPRQGSAEAQWGPLGGSDRSVFNLSCSGFSGAPLLVDAFWRGSIVARVTAPTGRIVSVKTSWPDATAIDRAIVAALGALPADPDNLQTERRTRLIAALRAGVSDAAVVSDAVLDKLLSAAGASSVNEYFVNYSQTTSLGPVTITISEGAPAPPLPKPLPVAAAILVREAASGLAQLLADSRLVREHMESTGLGRPEATGLKMLQSLLIVWVVPPTVFDDADWPGANAAQRRIAAGVWLAREGIGLAPVA